MMQRAKLRLLRGFFGQSQIGGSRLLKFNFSEKEKQDKTEQLNKKKQILDDELKTNPEFNEAYPQFKGVKPQTYIENQGEELDFLKSLGLVYRIPLAKSKVQNEQENYDRFVSGYKSPSGPLKYMSEEEKLKINILIDAQLQELEDTGLSREQLLFEDGQKGIPLTKDPFFQYLKSNYKAREIFVKKGEEYSVEKVIDIALRQDIGPDPSTAKSIVKSAKFDQYSKEDFDRQMKQKDSFEPENYYAEKSGNLTNYIKEFIKQDIKTEKMPIRKEEIYAKNMRQVNHLDIHWRNTALLSQFVNEAGRIKNKFQNRVDKSTQYQVAKNIKTAREMNLMPFFGFLKPSDRQSLTTLREDVEACSSKAINIETGHIYVKNRQQSNETQKNQVSHKDYLYGNIEQREQEDKNYETLVEAAAVAFKRKQQEVSQKGIKIEDLQRYRNKSVDEQKIYQHKPQVEDPNGIIELINTVEQQVQQKTPEKLKQSYDTENAMEAKPLFDETKSNGQKLSTEESVQTFNDITSKYGLKQLKYEDIVKSL